MEELRFIPGSVMPARVRELTHCISCLSMDEGRLPTHAEGWACPWYPAVQLSLSLIPNMPVHADTQLTVVNKVPLGVRDHLTFPAWAGDRAKLEG